jgi:nucleotide-binding universal stress UspA family protein
MARMVRDEMILDRPFELIMTGTDGSERAAEAARQAARISAASGAKLVVVYVIERRGSSDEGEAERALDAASEAARSLSLEPEVRAMTGDPEQVLVEHAEKERADLLCVGQDSGLLGGAIRIGRVAAHIVREARCSVMVARRAGPAFPERIACGVDGSEASIQTAKVAASLAAVTGAELRLVHVVPVFRGHNEEWTLEADEESPPELEPSVAAAASLGVSPIREMAMGRPERALVAATERDDVDLVVVGHRGISGVQRMLLGSVSEHVAHHARCSAMVARPRGGDAG